MQTRLTITDLQSAYRTGRFTPVTMMVELFARIAGWPDPAVWITRETEAMVLARAQALMDDPAATALPLYGIPFAVKDNIDVAGLPTTAACPAFAYNPRESATVVRRLEAAGAILIGKTNLDQFATGLVGMRSPYGAPRSLFSPSHVSGGSSSGSAVAVAAGLVAFSLGTDTAGSGRIPAAFNNIVGLKPTRGRVSASGVVPACRSLDCVSIFANSAAESDLVMEVVEGLDEDDIYARRVENIPLPAAFRFGVLAPTAHDFDHADGSSLYEAAIARLTALGGAPVPIDYAPFQDVARLLYDGPWVAERLAAIRAFAETRQDAMDPTVRDIILGARRYSAVDVFEGQYRLQALKRQTDAAWRQMDLLLLPTAPGHPTVAEVAADPVGANARLGLYTNFVNLLDCCAIAVPAGFKTEGLPFGVTLVAPAFCDRALAALAGKFHIEETS